MSDNIPNVTRNPDGTMDIDAAASNASARATLANALQSVDNLTDLLTMMAKRKKSHAACVEVLFVKKEAGNGIRLFVTAENTLDEVLLAKLVLEGVEEVLKRAIPTPDDEVSE